MRQRELGESSYWAPYIALMPEVHFFADEPGDVLLATNDPYFVAEAISYRDDLKEVWVKVSSALNRYPHLFSRGLTNSRHVFMQLYAQVCSRCFGWGAPHTAMVPMADTLNHSDVTVSFEIITRSMHLAADEQSTYFTKTKYMNDYSSLFNPTEEPIAEDSTPVASNIKGRFNRKNFTAN